MNSFNSCFSHPNRTLRATQVAGIHRFNGDKPGLYFPSGQNSKCRQPVGKSKPACIPHLQRSETCPENTVQVVKLISHLIRTINCKYLLYWLKNIKNTTQSKLKIQLKSVFLQKKIEKTNIIFLIYLKLLWVKKSYFFYS